MSKIFQAHSASGATLYAVFVNDTGDFWNGSAFESFTSGNWATYDVAMNEWGTSKIYRATIPTFVAGNYAWVAYVRAGGSPAQSDAVAGSGAFDWDGTEIIDLASLLAHGDTDWATADMDDVAAAVLTTPAYKLATNAQGYVTLIPASITAIASAVWGNAERTLTAATDVTAAIAAAVWAYSTRVLTAGTNLPTAASITTAVWAAATRTLTAFGFTVTETNSAAIKAVTDKLNTSVELDGSVYRFTTNALELAPDTGDATEANQDAILAAIADLAAIDAEVIAEAVLDAIVDGAVDVRTALKLIFASGVGKIVRTDTDPPTFALYNAAGDTVIRTIEWEADGSGRDVA